MKILFPTGLLLLFSGFVAGGEPAGLLSAKEPFRVVRDGGELTGRAATPFLATSGDVIRPGQGPVRLEGVGGETVLVGPGSALELSRSLHYRLLDGRMAVALPGGEAGESRLQASELEFRRIGVHDAGDGPAIHQVALGTNSTGSEIAVFSDGGMLSIHSLLSGDQIGIVGPGEFARLVRDILGEWTFVSPTMQETERETEGIGESDGEEGVFGLFESAFGGGGAAAGAGAAAVVLGGAIVGFTIVELTSEDSSGDGPSTTTQPRGPATVIVPPDDPEEPDEDWDRPPDEEEFF